MGFTNKSNFLNQTESNFLKEQLMDKLGARMDVFGGFYQIKIFSQYEFMINFWTFTGHASFSLFSGFHLITFLTVLSKRQCFMKSECPAFEYKNVFVILALFHKVKQLNEHPLSVAIPYFSCISLVLSIARNRMEPANTYEWQVICIPIRVSSIWLICHKGPYDGGYLWAGFPVSAEDSWSPFRVTASSCSPPETKHTLHSHLSWSEVCFV